MAWACTALAACSVGGGGGGGGTVLLCGPGGACPANQTCNANNVCVGNGLDTAAGGDVGQDAAGGGGDAAVKEAGTVPDSGAADTADKDTAAEVASSDVAPKDAQPDVPIGPVPATIAELQGAAASLTCENASGVTPGAKVVLEPAVVTGPPQLITASNGKKSTLFFVRPATGPTAAENAGMAVIIGVNPLAVQAGDVVQVTGSVIEFYCMTEITADAADAVVSKGKVGVPKPYDVSLATLVKNTEPYEDVLVRVSNVVVSDPNLPGNDGKLHGQLVVASGAASVVVALPYGSASLDTGGKTKFGAGDKLGSVAGHLNYSFGQWILRPRDDQDIATGF